MRQPMIIHDDGIALAADLETPEGCCGACPLVILLHGFSSARNRIHTLQAAADMREEGFATLRFDLYGHGESGGEFSRHTLYKWISNTMAVIDHVRGMGYTDLYLSGHSQGGLVLRAPAFMIPRCAREGNLLGFRFDPENVPDSVPALNGLTLDGNYIRVAQAVRAEETAARFKGPVLILHGDEDDVVPLKDSKRMAALYADCELAVMHGETHHYDRHPEEMQDLIRAFCRKIKP